MPTSGGALVSLSNGKNRVASIKDTGVNIQSSKSPRQQQMERIAQHVSDLPKGTNLSVLIRNTHATDDQNFNLFDAIGIAAAKSGITNGADIVITSTFAGLGTAAGYTCLKSFIVGAHLGSLGTSFKFSDESIIDTANVNIWNGNLENYNNQSLQNYLLLAEDTYANDQKILPMSVDMYVNEFLAITGTLPAGGSLNLLFNVVAIANF